MQAVKVESCTSSKQVLKIEALILKRLQGLRHTCHLYGCGRTDKVNFVVMTLLGQNLSDLRKKQVKQVFSLSTVLRIAVQVVTAVQEMHDCGFLHRDIKPSNFAMGIGTESRKCCLFDFGLARQYTTPTGELKQPRPVAGFRGTVRYASINAHLGNELGRHDDLWSVFYMLIELATGSLPWRRIREKEEAGRAKQDTDHDELIKGLPLEFKLFMTHLKSLSYHDKPDYQHLINLFQNAQQRHGVNTSDPYDWEAHFTLPSSVTSASGISPPIDSPECPATPEVMDSQRNKDSEKSLGERVKKICQVFQTLNSPKATRAMSAGKRNISISPQSSDKTKQQHTLKSPSVPASSNNNNNSSKHANSKASTPAESGNEDNQMQVDQAREIGECEKKDHSNKKSFNDRPVPDVVPISGDQPPKSAFVYTGTDSDPSPYSNDNPMVKTRTTIAQMDTAGCLGHEDTSGRMDSGSQSSVEGPQVKRFERVDSPSSGLLEGQDLYRWRDSHTQAVRGDSYTSSVNIPNRGSDRAGEPSQQLFTSSLVMIPRPPSIPPRTGYFCSSARKRKFVAIGRRILANGLRTD